MQLMLFAWEVLGFLTSGKDFRKTFYSDFFGHKYNVTADITLAAEGSTIQGSNLHNVNPFAAFSFIWNAFESGNDTTLYYDTGTNIAVLHLTFATV